MACLNVSSSVREVGVTFCVLSLWTLTSFLCHYTGKQFLTESDALASVGLSKTDFHGSRLPALHALILTAIQMAFCTTFVQLREPSSTLHRHVATLSHALASLATNLSMAVMFASSTFAIKMMEPITSAILQFILLGRPLSPLSIVSLPVIVGGAIVFTNDPQNSSTISLGTLMALASNIILSFRNIAIKQMSNNGTASVTFRMSCHQLLTPLSFVTMVLCLVLSLETRGTLPANSILVAVLATLSGIFHVSYSYVSTGIVLKHMSVVSHAVSNIFKRVWVVLLLYLFGQRQASGLNFLGLISCLVGLIIYTFAKSQTDEATDKTPPKILSWKTIAKGLGILASIIITVTATSYIPSKVESTPMLIFMHRDAPMSNLTHSFRTSFGHGGFLRPTESELLPVDVSRLTSETFKQLPTFLKRRLIEYPEKSNFLSKELLYVDEIIRESQRLHFNIIGDALKKYKYAMLFDIASFENKGDPCITVGEIYFLRRMNIKIVYYCNFHACVEKHMDKAKDLAQQYGPDQLVILVHGGGNIVGYAANDVLRFKLLIRFPTFQMFVFPQSIWIRQMNNPHVKRTIDNYCCHPNLTLVLRDQKSYDTAREIYKGSSRLLMAPDMAFQIGRVQRFMSPVFDILWLKRADGESPGYKEITAVPQHLRVHISDWWKWMTPAAGSSLEKAHYVATNGFFFLQRGRVVITDRLHGHILSTLMDIPHVLIDNKAKKLSSYHNTWTKSLHNTVITDNPAEALDLAIGLLEKFNDTLPPIVPYLEVNEYFGLPKAGRSIVGYP